MLRRAELKVKTLRSRRCRNITSRRGERNLAPINREKNLQRRIFFELRSCGTRVCSARRNDYRDDVTGDDASVDTAHTP